ncbi:hypothetical protein [Burkholderia vietnamiensis]|uniref:hypothetical protein n=1 Tax=Burkholderia vietnamiensis TaxID=60552 RepID=UPI0012D89F50|nr:hypothetical protein [Burkholderia vietnamiensis]MDN7927846.1 hypothetical protein [Burkholderia vietnamiensis]HDR9249898.1 hypothetical protein [Burkholderia vietnamiensis]
MENYADAAGRHWGDGLLLERESRLENADQLYGIAAECAIKAALITSAGNCASNGLAKAYKAHIDELWDRIAANALPRHLAALPPLLKMDNPYSDWRIDQRYAGNGIVTADALERHKTMAKRLVSAVGVVGTRTK